MIPHVQLPGIAANWTSKDRAAIAAAIGGDCRLKGFFFAHNHGIPADLFRDVYAEMRRFYRLPQAEKSQFDATEQSQFLGYRGLGRERSRTHGGTESCEQYRVGNTTGELPLPVSADFYHALFPKSLELFHHLTHLGDGILAACALDLGLEENAFIGKGTPLHRLGLNYYGATRPAAAGSAAGYAMSPHIDLSSLTILDQDEAGLEVREPDGQWLEVPAVPGALFVFLGDYVQRLVERTAPGGPTPGQHGAPRPDVDSVQAPAGLRRRRAAAGRSHQSDQSTRIRTAQHRPRLRRRAEVDSRQVTCRVEPPDAVIAR
ncbi:2-oxoglutarate and iron-dependent oxygenase domain-containing protein [Streptomyces sp. URMC 126]|uniref:2-oxoglutarate and iron-dependent oxygenase domain-containing protein n=1 Tax=Streptomyces sp. URMC 126 TaxID=3423401 RepID=UPI003F1D9F5B